MGSSINCTRPDGAKREAAFLRLVIFEKFTNLQKVSNAKSLELSILL